VLRPISLALLLVALAATGEAFAQAAPRAFASAAAAPEWNEQEIAWRTYEEGVAAMAATGKPGVLVFKTDWCPHCIEYSRLFHEPRVVELSKRFVMIRVDRDAQQSVSSQYGQFGDYVPRTLFVKPDGRVDWYHHGANTRYPYFIDENDSAELIALLEGFPPTSAVAAPAAD